MGRIILDSELRQRLGNVSEQLELCDETGRTLALVLPLEQYKLLVGRMQVPLSDEEIRRRQQAHDGSSLSDFWERMGRQ